MSLRSEFSEEEGVIYDNTDKSNVLVRAGYLDKLISLLADGKRGNNEYIRIFLLAHRDFIESGHLLLKLIRRFGTDFFITQKKQKI